MSNRANLFHCVHKQKFLSQKYYKPIDLVVTTGFIIHIIQKNISKIILLLVMGICLIILVDIHNQSESYGLVPINSTNWSNIISDNEKTFVYVGRESCEQCSTFKPMLETTIEDNKIKFYYFDTDVNENVKDEIIKRYNIIAVPSI